MHESAGTRAAAATTGRDERVTTDRTGRQLERERELERGSSRGRSFARDCVGMRGLELRAAERYSVRLKLPAY